MQNFLIFDFYCEALKIVIAQQLSIADVTSFPHFLVSRTRRTYLLYNSTFLLDQKSSKKIKTERSSHRTGLIRKFQGANLYAPTRPSPFCHATAKYQQTCPKTNKRLLNV